ncbi:dentin sialophosphoprotein [Dendroctonus ponderosae]|uniref:DUF4794 domain-containing protein n=1 Tax=Dendroctonus ponderosae TaxID=77166 RepID=U4USY9_DENPD|nr:dentin sialophosphoprotein [Dendroctonus ponderosae]ERL93291.1 hypothetical protein D910_10587 [Dendroctonus ponderosae]KAH1010786.1 hypothetical protein HUJ05_005030 [Dendroctonus ponderosae]
MAKIQITLALVTLLYLSEALPLGDSSESSSEASQTSSSNLGVHPLLTGTSESSDTEATTEENSTGGVLIEESYIEVLLPGSPQVNASALDALLDASSPNATKSKRSAPNQEPEEPSQAKASSTIKPVLYAQQSRAVRDVSLNRTGIANNTGENQATNSSVPAVLIHLPLSRASRDTSAKINAQAKKPEAEASKPAVPAVQYKTRPARDISDEEDDCPSEEDSSPESESTVQKVPYPAGQSDEHRSSEDSSEEEPAKEAASTGEGSQQQNPDSRYARAIAEETATETGSTETVVYITPEAKKLPVN